MKQPYRLHSTLVAVCALVVLMIVFALFANEKSAADSIEASPALASQSAATLQTTPSAPRAKGPYPGIYTFLDNDNLDPALYPFLTGGHMKFHWADIELMDDYFDWSEVDDWLEGESSLGKPAAVGFTLYDGRCCGGMLSPRWLLWQNEETVVRCDAMYWPIPRYWHPQYLAEYKEYIHTFAQRYDGDPRIAWIELGTGIFGENKAADTSDWSCLLQAGLTEAVWEDYSRQVMDAFRSEFTRTPLLFQFAPLYVPETNSPRQRKVLTDYAASLGIGLKHNGLQGDAESAVFNDPNKTYYKSGAWDPFFGWWQNVPVGWESYSTQFCETVPKNLWCVYSGLNKHADYFVFNAGMITDPARQPFLQFAAPYLGVELVDTDSVWVALRESKLSWFPQKGNFDFWLYQNDAVLGGKSKAVWDKTAAPEGLFTRRTDRLGGNPNMYFDVEDSWLHENAVSAVKIEVVYLDEGTDAWSLHYDAAGSLDKIAGTVRKHNTGQWLTQTFDLADAYFGNRLPGGGDRPGSDFYLASDDFDDYFHRLRVFKSGVAPTPTPLPIATATPTPTPPNNTKPTYMRVRDGVNGYNGTSDTWIGGGHCNRDPNDDAIDSGNTPHNTHAFLYLRASRSPSAPPDSPVHEDVCNILIKFDLRHIPKGATIVNAKLVFKATHQSNANRLYVNAFDLVKNWDETQATWYNASAGGPWSTPGADGSGDHSALPIDTAILAGTAERSGWVGIFVTPLVQRWVSDPSGNRGVLVRPFGNLVGYELVASENATVAYRPALEILYYPPGWTPPSPTTTPTPSNTPTLTPTDTPSPTPSATPTTVATPTPSPIPTDTITPAPTATPTPTPAPTATPSPTPSAGAISGVVFHDLNGDNQHGEAEAGISGATLKLMSSSGAIRQQLTESAGVFYFSDLPPGSYTLVETAPPGWDIAWPTNTLDLVVSANHTHAISFAHQSLSSLWLPLLRR